MHVKLLAATVATLAVAAVPAPAEAARRPGCLEVAHNVRKLPGYSRLGPMVCKYRSTYQSGQQFRIIGTRPGHRYVGLVNMYPYPCDRNQALTCFNAEMVRFVGRKN